MTQVSNQKIYDLRERTKKFAKRVREFVKSLPMALANLEMENNLFV